MTKGHGEPALVTMGDTHEMNGIQRESNRGRAASGIAFQFVDDKDDYHRDRDAAATLLNYSGSIQHRERG